MHVGINKRTLDIAGGVDVGKNDLDDGTGNQSIMFECAIDAGVDDQSIKCGYVTNETEDATSFAGFDDNSFGEEIEQRTQE